MTASARPPIRVFALIIAATTLCTAVPQPARAAGPDPDACRSPVQLGDDTACWWATFLDPYSGATIDYPADLLRPEPGYGETILRRFVSGDGEVALSVWAAQVNSSLTIREAMATDIYRSGFDTVTDRKADEAGYLIGGHHGSRAFMKRVRWAHAEARMTETACITWPKDRGPEWKALAEKIVETLRDGRGWARNPRLNASEIQHGEGYCGGL